MKKTKAFQILSFNLPLYLIFFSSSLTLCLYINMRQLKPICFICNIFNCLNEENKRFINFLSLFFFYLLFILFGIMCLIDILMKKTKSFMYLIFFLSSLALCLYLSVRQLINIFNCLNEENKIFTNSLCLCLCLSLFLFSFSLTFSLYLNVRQLKRMSFIWNAFN
jgi:hypothetical protein